MGSTYVDYIKRNTASFSEPATDMGRALILRVDEGGVEYLPTLSTHSLEAVEVPEGVVKEWRRRKGAAAAATEHAHQLEMAGFVLEHPGVGRRPNSGEGRGSPAAQTLSKRLGHYLRRIKKMAPLDERGMWLLKNLLTQVRITRSSWTYNLKENNFSSLLCGPCVSTWRCLSGKRRMVRTTA